MTSALEKKATLVFALALAAIAALGALEYLSARRLSEDYRWVSHTHQALTELQGLRRYLNRADAKAQTFVLTGDPESLNEYERSVAGFRATRENLRGLTADNPIQEQRLARLDERFRDGLFALQEEIAARQANQLDAQRVAKLEQAIRVSLDNVRGVILEMEAQEAGLLREREEAAEWANQWTRTLVLAGSAIALFLLSAAMFLLMREVKRRNQAERSLRASNTTLETQARLINLADDAIFVRDLDYKILNWNKGAERTYGWTKEEALGKIAYELLRAEFPEPLHAIQRKILESGSWRGEVVQTRRDGSRIVVSSRQTLHRDESGVPFGVLMVNRDVTERKRAEDAVRAANVALGEQARLLDLAYDAIIVRDGDANGAIRFWNQGAERMYGWTKLEALGKNKYHLLQTEFPLAFEDFRRALATTGEWEGELVHTRRDSSRMTVTSRHVVAKRNDQGQPTQILEINRDITERRRSEARFRQLLEFAPDSIVIVDHGGRIILTNAQTEKLFGYDRKELLGQPVEMLVPERFRAKHPGHRGAYFESPRIRPMGAGLDLYALRKDGTEFPVEISLSPIEANGETVVSSAIRDITARKEIENSLHELSGQLLHLQENERRSVSMGLHDGAMQTIATVIWRLALIEEHVAANRLPAALHELTEAQTLAQQASRELRSFSYLLYPPELNGMGLHGALRGFVEGFIDRTGIQVKLDAPRELGRLPRDAEATLFRVAQECLTNVQRHSESLTAEVRLHRETGSVSLEVRDFGKGFPEVGGLVHGMPVKLGVGIQGIKERLRRLGGQLEIAPAEPGTRVRVTIPYAPRPTA